MNKFDYCIESVTAMLLQLGVYTKTITLSLAPHTIVFTSALIFLTKYIATAFLNFLIIAPYRIIKGKY